MRKMTMSITLCSLLLWFGCQRAPNQSGATSSEKPEPTGKVENQPTPVVQNQAAPQSPSNISTTAPVQKEKGMAKSNMAKSAKPAHDAASEKLPGEKPRPAAFAPKKYTIPASTPIPVRLIDGISTETNKAGDTFLASLGEPLILNGVTLFPRDTSLKGKIITLEEPGRVSGVASISLQLTEIHPKGGSPIPIETESFSQTAKSEKKKDAAIIGGGAAVGTAIGAIAGGKKGAAIGAAAGGGGSTAYVLSTKGKQLKYPSETLLTFKLAEPLTITR